MGAPSALTHYNSACFYRHCVRKNLYCDFVNH